MMSNIINALKPRHPEDIPVIRGMLETLPFLNRFCFSDPEIELLWTAFSRAYGGSYLNVGNDTLKNFLEWAEQ